MKPHLLIAVDGFGESQIEAIANSLAGWATWERIPETTPSAEYRAKLATAEIVIGWPEAKWLFSNPVSLLLCPSVGYETYLDQELELKPGFIFCNAGGVYSEGVAEHCIAMMMALTRRLPQYIRLMQTKTWRQLTSHAELAGALVCIVGLGEIGMAIARRCAALGMSVTGVRRSPISPSDLIRAVYQPQQLREALAKADHVVAALPGGKTTARIFNGAVFDAMKSGAYFYNVGRGSVVNEDELIKHLETGHLAGAGLDVFEEEPLPSDNPLWKMDNVIVTPHMAGYTADYADRLSEMIVANLHRYHQHQPLMNVIDLGKVDT